MKHCPECNRTYADETLTFCLADGALLSAPYDSEATQRIPSSRAAISPPTEILPSQQIRSVEQKGSPKFIYGVIAVMAALLVALASIIIIPLMSQDRKDDKKLNQTTSTNDKSMNETSNTEARQTPASKPKESPLPAVSTSNPINPNLPLVPTELTGRWQGQWSSPVGTIFSANLTLEAIGTSSGVQGNINWTMKSTPQESKQSKIGLTAVEYVRGSYNPETRMLTMEGYREDDPKRIIILDKYRLVLAQDNRSLGGATWNHGRWRGRLSLTR